VDSGQPTLAGVALLLALRLNEICAACFIMKFAEGGCKESQTLQHLTLND
jgi:hypothetical protein